MAQHATRDERERGEGVSEARRGGGEYLGLMRLLLRCLGASCGGSRLRGRGAVLTCCVVADPEFMMTSPFYQP